jgi:hypothetical protein
VRKHEGGGWKMVVYLFSTGLVPIDWNKYNAIMVKMTKISIDDVRKILQASKWVSVIGHEATAKVLTQLLGIEIPMNRIVVKMEPWDEGIHFVLATRLPEGRILTEDELRQLEFYFIRSQVIPISTF